MKNKIKNYLLEDMEFTQQVVQDLNSWNGCLEHLEFIPMECFDEYMEGYTATEIANRIHFGNFSPCDSYFQFNGYGNLESYSSYQVEDEIKGYIEEIADQVISNKDDIDLPIELKEILEEE